MKTKLTYSIWIIVFIQAIFYNQLFASFKGQDVYTTTIVFPANFVVGDYIEFVKVSPSMGLAGPSGYYQVSIAYVRGNIAAASTHLAAISHANPNIWREAGKTNSNKYVSLQENFTIDCNTESGNSRFRIRAINTYGVSSDNLVVAIKVTSINLNDSYTALSTPGNDTGVNKFLPMTEEWDLYVGKLFSSEGASIAIKALSNGNVGIGTTTPTEKLSVNGKIRAKEVKVETANWPDYVFDQDYKVLGLQELDAYIKANKHLPEMPSAKEVEANGMALGELVKLQQKKIEELTLHLIEKDKALSDTQKKLIQLAEAHQKSDLINTDLLKRLAEVEKNIKAINPKKLN